jgi:hypothetical protein
VSGDHLPGAAYTKPSTLLLAPVGTQLPATCMEMFYARYHLKNQRPFCWLSGKRTGNAATD